MQAPSEDIWGMILSQNEEKIREIYKLLSEEETLYVTNHLQRMCSEEGWHPGQVTSANFALNVIQRSQQNKGHHNNE